MYEVYQASAITSYMQAFDDMALPLVIGEFGPENNGQPVDEASVMAQAQQRGNGYIGWSWSGNGGCGTVLDMVTNFSTTLTTWGQIARQRHQRHSRDIGAGDAYSAPAGNNLTVSPTRCRSHPRLIVAGHRDRERQLDGHGQPELAQRLAHQRHQQRQLHGERHGEHRHAAAAAR